MNNELKFNDEVKKYIKKELGYSDIEGEKRIDEFLKVMYICNNIPELANYQVLPRKIINQANSFITGNGIDEDIDFRSFNYVNEFLEIMMYLNNANFIKEKQPDGDNIPNYLCSLNLISKNVKKIIKDDVNSSENRNIKFGNYSYPNEMHNAYARCYEIRNKEAHTARDYNLTQRNEIVTSVFKVYLETSNTFKEIIDKKYQYIDLIYNTSAEKYAHNFIIEYKKKHINYIILDGEENSNQVQTLPNLISKNKHVKITGEAGMGKSTTLEYITYNEISKFQNTGILPILIPLCDVFENKNAIMKKLTQILECSEEYIDNILKNGNSINLYLDGLNEIKDEERKQSVTDEINKMLSLYPNTKIVLTDRDVSTTGDPDRIGITKNIKSYKIKYMNSNQIEEFIEKNGINDDVKSRVRILLDTDEKKERVKKPLVLKQLIDTINISNIDELPNFDEEFTKIYITAILKREEVNKETAGAKYLSNYLNKIALYLFDHEQTVISRNKILEIISEETKNLQLTEIKSDKILELILQIGFIQEKEYMEYSFSNDDYLNYFSFLGD